MSDVTIQQERTISFTTYTIKGEREAVELAVGKLMREWPKDGYGTWAVYNDKGAVVTRANSCE